MQSPSYTADVLEHSGQVAAILSESEKLCVVMVKRSPYRPTLSVNCLLQFASSISGSNKLMTIQTMVHTLPIPTHTRAQRVTFVGFAIVYISLLKWRLLTILVLILFAFFMKSLKGIKT